jgi:hypothetical protein
VFEFIMTYLKAYFSQHTLVWIGTALWFMFIQFTVLSGAYSRGGDYLEAEIGAAFFALIPFLFVYKLAKAANKQ